MTEPVQTPAPMAPPPCHATRWRIATIICLILLSVAAATGMSMMEQFKAQLEHLQKKLKAVPQVKYVAVLLDDKHQPAQLITFDPQDGYLLIQRLNDVKEGQEDSMQLWALDDQDRPLSLGVLATKIRTAQIAVRPTRCLSPDQESGHQRGEQGRCRAGQASRDCPFCSVAHLSRKPCRHERTRRVPDCG
jgi:hypothetical protein